MADGGMPKGMRAVFSWVIGVAIIAFILLIMVIIFGNLSGNVGFGQESTAFAEEKILMTPFGRVPASAENRINGALSVVVTNVTGETIEEAGNYTILGVIITSIGTSGFNGSTVNVTGTVTYDSQGLADSQSIITNYTSSAVNTSAQFPTVGTIIGIAILLLILIGLLIFAITKMMGISGAASGGGSNASFG